MLSITPPHLKYVATLPCNLSLMACFAYTNVSQGIVATYARCGGIFNIPPHLAHVATLLCETLVSAKQAINDKLQGGVATYLRCGGVIDNIYQIKKSLLLSL